MAKSPTAHVPPTHRVPAHLARRFHQVCLGITAEVTERAGLTPVEYAMITALEDAPAIDQGSLAARLGIDAVSAHHVAKGAKALPGYAAPPRRKEAPSRVARALVMAIKAR